MFELRELRKVLGGNGYRLPVETQNGGGIVVRSAANASCSGVQGAISSHNAPAIDPARFIAESRCRST